MSGTPKVVSEELLRAYQDGIKRYHDEMEHQAQLALRAKMELAEVKRDCDEWKEVADQMRADRDAYRKERDAFEERMRAAERLLEHALRHCGRTFTAQDIEAHPEAAREEDVQ